MQLGGGTAVAGVTYSWSPTTGLSNPNIFNPTATLTAAGPVTYTLTARTSATCFSTDQVVVTVLPLPVAFAGPPVATCSGVPSVALGSPAVTGYTYSWSPTTGLSNPTSAQPTVTLPNTSGAPIVQVYVLTVSSGTTPNCTNTSPVRVTINPAAVANPTPTASLCSGATVTLGGVTPVAGTAYGWTPTTGLNDPTSANPTLTLTNGGPSPTTATYTLTATTANGCIATGTVTVTINPNPIADAGPDVTQCGSVSQQLGVAPVAGNTYRWTTTAVPSGLSNPNSANPTVTLTNASTTANLVNTYTLTVTSGPSCVSTDAVTVTVYPRAIADPTPTLAFCAGATATLGGVTVVPGATYSWSPTTGLSDPTLPNPTITLPNAGTAPLVIPYTLTVTNAAALGVCTASAVVTVTVNPTPVAIAGPDRAFCSGATATLGGGAAVAGYTYAWTPTTGLANPASPTTTVTLTNTGPVPTTTPYTLTVSSTTTPVCVNTATVNVTVNPNPIANAGPNQTICSGGTATLGVAPVTGYTYSWSPTTGLSDPTAAQPVATLTNLGLAPTTTTYTLTVSSTTTPVCTSTSTVAITVNPNPIANAGPPVATCSNVTSVPLGSGTTTTTGVTYLWTTTATPSGLSSATSANPTVTLPNTTGAPIVLTYTLTVTSTLAPFCAATSSVAVTINPAAVATPSPATVAFCSGGSAVLGGTTAVPGTTYRWTPTAGLSDPTSPAPTVTLTNLTGAAITTTYTLTATTANSCTATGTVAVTVNPNPAANAGPDLTQCGSVNQTIGTPGVTGNTYLWTTTATPSGLSDPTLAQPLLTLTNASTTADLVNTYTLTVTTPAGCVATDAVTVTVHPRAIADPSPTTLAFCSGASAVLGGVTVVPGTTYLWTPATGLSNPTAPNPTITLTNVTGAPVTTTYTLTATTAPALGACTATATVAVTVNPLPVADAGTDIAVCGTVNQRIGTAAVAGNTYLWTTTAVPSGLSDPTLAQPTVTLTNASNTVDLVNTYTLTVTSAAGCVSTDAVTVTVYPAAVAEAGAPATFCTGGTAQLGNGPGITGTTYAWSPATGLSNANIANPTVTLTNTGLNPVTTTYTLTATTARNCTAQATVAITVNPRAIPVPGPAAVSYCTGGSVVIGAAPVANTRYLWRPATGLSSATVANPTVTLTNLTSVPVTTTYTLVATSTFAGAACADSATVAVTVNPRPVAVPTPTLTTCSGVPVVLTGATAIPGVTYAWTSATLADLNDPTLPNPTATVTNTTSAPITRTYTLTATNPTSLGGCTTVATVTLTVNPAAIAQAVNPPGTAITFCSGGSAPLGGSAIAGSTYVWTPTTGLSNPNVFNPTVTLTNTTAAPITTKYFVLVTTANGCFAKDSVNVTVNPAAIAQAGTAATFCSGGTAQLGGAGPAIAGSTYAWTPTTGLSNPALFNPTVTLTNLTAAPITIKYRLLVTTGFGCTAKDSVSITVNQAAVAQAINPPGTSATFCSGFSAQLGVAAVAGNTYAWTPAAGLSSASIANPVVSLTNATAAPITTKYFVLVTTAQGCTAKDSVLVTVNPAAIAQAGTAATFCSGFSAQLGGAGPAIAGSTYAWTPTTGLNNAVIFNPTVTLTNLTAAPITTKYRLLVTTALGCTAKDSVNITVNPAAIAQAGNDATFCSGATAQLGGTGPAIAGSTYAWTPTTGLNNPAIFNPTVSLTNNTAVPATTRYFLLVTTGLGCTARDSADITVNPAAIVDAGPDATLCDRKTVTLGTPAQPGYTYSWTPTTGLSSATAPQPVFTAVNTGTAPITRKYFLTASTAGAVGACSARDSVLVTINPRPAADSIYGPASVCPTVTGIAYSVRNPRFTAYQWLVSGAVAFSGNGTPAITVDWGPAGAGSVKVFTLNANGCSSDTVSLPVIINPILQTARPTGPTPVCQANGPYTYQTIYANGSLYSWTILGGTQVSTNLASVVINWNPVTVPTIGKIVVQETSNPASGVRCLGQSDTLRVLINPSPRPTLALTGPARACQSAGPVTFTLPGGFAGSTYAFTFAGNPVTTTGSSVTVSTLPAPGAYVVTARETSAQGCAGPLFTFMFTVDPTPAAVSITGPRYLCDATQTQQYSVPNTPGSTYVWTATNLATGTSISGQGTSQITVRFAPGAANYVVTATETSQFGCSGATATITAVPDSPSVVLALASVATTSNTSIVLTFSAPNSANTPNPVQVLRRVAGSGPYVALTPGPVLGATSFTDNTVDATTYSYEYQLSLTNGCGTTVISQVARTVRLAARATAGAGGRNQGTIALTWNAYKGFAVAGYRIYRRDASGAATLVQTIAADSTANLPNPGTDFNQCYRVVAFSATGQESNSNEVCVNFENPVAFYNVITPNHDGLNDVLEIDNIKLYPGNTFTIFNRWGREVYTTTNYQNNWGDGDDIAAGVYYYLLKLPNGTSTKGWFEVIK